MVLSFHTNGKEFSTALYTSHSKVRIAPTSSKNYLISVNPDLPNAHNEYNTPRDAQKIGPDLCFAIHRQPLHQGLIKRVNQTMGEL